MTKMNKENGNDDKGSIEEEMKSLMTSLHEIQITQRQQGQSIQRVATLSSRMEGLERRQEEMVKILTGLRSELAGISSGMARRDSMILGRDPIILGSPSDGFRLAGTRRESLILANGSGSGLNNLRRDSLILDPTGRRDSGSGTIPVMEVEPWEPSQEVQEVLDRLLERQFLLSPWVREKRLRNQLRLILKDYLEAGPVRRSTVTKLVHDAHQVFPVWRSQIRETMLTSWDHLQNADLEDVANTVFAQFKKPRFPDEIEAGLLFAEHMIEAVEKAGRN